MVTKEDVKQQLKTIFGSNNTVPDDIIDLILQIEYKAKKEVFDDIKERYDDNLGDIDLDDIEKLETKHLTPNSNKTNKESE